MNPLARFAKTLSNIFVPIIPAIVASGLLMGLLGMMKAFQWVDPDASFFPLRHRCAEPFPFGQDSALWQTVHTLY